jgi:hypothetical protein
MSDERGEYLKLTEKEKELLYQIVVDAYVEGATAKTRYKAFLRMLKQVLPQAAEHMTDKKFAHFYDRLPLGKKREIESRRVVQSGVAQSKNSKRLNEQQKWAKGIHFRV